MGKVLVENNDFIIYGENNLEIILDDLIFYLTQKKQEFLSFFGFSNFPLIQIYLFQNREEYYEYNNHPVISYETASFSHFSLAVCYSNISKNSILSFLKRKITHELVHIFYHEIYKNFKTRPLWLDEGLAIFLSEERKNVLASDFSFRSFYLDEIVRRDKEIPKIEYLKEHGNEYGKFLDTKTNKYDGYALSFLLVCYLIERKENIEEIIRSEEKIKNLEKTILEDCISYYNQKYPVKENFLEIKTDGELMDYMNKYILYGWLDKEKKEHIDTLKGYQENYQTGSIEEILNFKLGTCIEQAKLIQYWFTKMGIENKLFCLRSDSANNQDIKMHVFVLFQYKEYWYHFEHSAKRNRGIYKFPSLEEAIEKTSRKFLQSFDLKELTEIPSIPDHLSFNEFNLFVSQFESYKMDDFNNKDSIIFLGESL